MRRSYGSSIRRTKATSASVGCGGSSAGENARAQSKVLAAMERTNPDSPTAGSRNRPTERLEPYVGKLVSTVLRGTGLLGGVHGTRLQG